MVKLLEQIFVNLHRVYSDPRVLILAYGDVAKAKGANTVGGDEKSLDGINLKKIDEISASLLDGTWQAGKARRVMIPKPGTTDRRPLTVLSPYDKIVASAIKITLNAIFEKQKGLDRLPSERYFHKFSHGFRPNRGCHSALDTTITWGITPWYIKADIKKCYDTINQKRLMSIIGNSITDQMMVDTLYKFFKMRVKNLDEGGPDTSKGVGVSQGNPLSPLLANIYLNELDQFMENLKKETDKGVQGQTTTKEWRSVTWVKASELAKAKTHKAKSSLRRELYRKKVKEANKAGIVRKPVTDEQYGEKVYHRLNYVRYADDYLIAIKGPKSLAKEIQTRTQNFLKSNLQFTLKEGDLIHGVHNVTRFLGFDIKTPKRNERAIVETRKILSFKKMRNKLVNRKKMMEERYEKGLMKIYESERRKILKIIVKGRTGQEEKKQVIKELAYRDAEKLKEAMDMKIKTENQEGSNEFKFWVQREYSNLISSKIQENDLKILGFTEVIEARENLLKAMEKASGNENLTTFKLEEVQRIKANPNYKQMHVDRIIYGQPQGLNPKLYTPIKELKNKLQSWGMISKQGRPKASGAIFRYHDISIIEHYKMKALGMLNYYRPTANFHEVKKLVDYHLRWSLLHTLAGKHTTTVHRIISTYGKTPVIKLKKEGKEYTIATFLNSNDINHRSRGFTKNQDQRGELEKLERPIVKISIPKALFAGECAVEGCTDTDIEVHHVRALRRVRKGFIVESIKSGKKTLKGGAKVESALSRKQIPLCRKHHAEWHKLTHKQINEKYLRKMV